MVNEWLREVDNQGRTPVECVAQSGHASLAQLVFTHEAEDQDYAVNGPSALHRAALTGDTEVLFEALKGDGDPAACDEGGETPLHKAARQGRVLVVEVLAPQCDVNAQNGYGMTPLHYAALNANVEVAEILLRFGADAHVVSDVIDGLTPLQVADAMGYGSMKGVLQGEDVFY